MSDMITGYDKLGKLMFSVKVIDNSFFIDHSANKCFFKPEEEGAILFTNPVTKLSLNGVMDFPVNGLMPYSDRIVDHSVRVVELRKSDA